MNKIQKIVFPVDFSRRSIQGARRRNCRGVFHRSRGPRRLAASGRVVLSRNLSTSEDKATPDLDFFCDHNLPACNVRRIVRIGEKANGISVLAQDEKADLIMIPRDHQMFVERLVRDSITAKIFNDCPVPVWTAEHLG